jgi:hypothetical protein
MFGRWVEAEATDNAAAAAEADDAAAAATDRRSRSRLTLRIGLDEYLTLLGVVRDEWKQLETGLTSAARQLSDLDQPVSIDPLMQYLGFGTCIDGIRMGPRLVMRSFLESRFAASVGIRIQLELLPSSPGQVVQRMEVPFPSLVAMATKSRSSLGDLYERWYNSLSSQQRQQQERGRLQHSFQPPPPPLPLQQSSLSLSTPPAATLTTTAGGSVGGGGGGLGKSGDGYDSRRQRGDLRQQSRK